MENILNMFGFANAPPPEEPSNEDDSSLFSDEMAPFDPIGHVPVMKHRWLQRKEEQKK